MYRGDEFSREHQYEQFYVFTDAQKTINGCVITRGTFRINQLNRGITVHQMIPFWSIEDVLFKIGKKLVSYDLYNNCFLHRWHYAFPAKVCFNSEVEIIDNNYYTDGIQLEDPIPIHSLPVWSNEEIVTQAVKFYGLHLCYVKNPSEDLVMSVLDKFPIAICFVKQQTIDMWRKIINNKYTFLNLYKYARIDDPAIYRMGIAIQMERIVKVAENENSDATNLVTKTCCESIKKILLQTPEKYRDLLFDELPRDLRAIIEDGLIKDKIKPITGKEFMSKLGSKLTDQYIVLLDPSCKTSGQSIKHGYNKYETNVIPSEMNGFWIMKPEHSLKMINGFSRSEIVRHSPFHTQEMVYYFTFFSFVSVPSDAKVYLGEDPRFNNVYITNELFIHKIRPIHHLFLLQSKTMALDCCSKYGYLLKFVKNPTMETMVQACRNCPRALLLCELPSKECITTVIENATDSSCLVLCPNPTKVLTESVKQKYGGDVEKYLPRP